MQKKNEFNFFYSIFMGFKIFGLAPFGGVLGKQKTKRLTGFRYSWIGMGYNITLLLVLFSSNCVTIYLKIFHDKHNVLNVDTALEIINRGSLAICLSITLIIYCIKQNMTVTIINRFIDLTNRLITQSHILYSVPTKKYIKISIILIHILNYLVFFISAITTIPLDLRIFTNVLCPTVIEFLLGSFMVQYALMLCFLEDRYESLNVLLQLLMKSNPKKFRNTIYPAIKVSYNDELREKLSFIQNTRRILCEVSYQTSDTLGLPALITVAHFCFKLTYDTYTIILSVMKTSSSLCSMEMIIIIVLIIKDLFPMVVLTTYGTRIIEQTKRSSAIVHRVMAECPANMNLIKYQLQQFSMELLHQGEISFTACGFIAIDGSLLKSIISTTITYMVILLQYIQTK